MRWIWIDKFLEFESGRRARSIKNLTLAEDHLHDHFPGHPVMPNSLILEGLAQTGGLLVGEFHQFAQNVVLAKVPRAVFHFAAVPGDTLVYEAIIEYIKKDGALVRGTSHVGERLQAEVEILFAHMDAPHENGSVFEPENFVFTMGLLGVFQVGRSADGSQITRPGVNRGDAR